jgi:hypothetical protein
MTILRPFSNKPGVSFDAGKHSVIFAEDMNNIGGALDSHAGRLDDLEEGSAVPAKATGSEVNTGTDDAKFITPKALADSDYAKTSDIPSVPVKASYTELNAENDDTKFATAFAIGSSNIVKDSKTQTLTNKRIKPTFNDYTNDDDFTPNISIHNQVSFTALAEDLTLQNPTGTPTQGEKLIIRIKDDGYARALTFGTQYRAMGVALPTTTVVSKTMYLGFIYNSTDTKWDLVALAQEA